MEELIVNMVGCLLGALGLGFLFGWFIKNAFAKEHYEPKIEELKLNCARNKDMIAETEKERALIKEQFLSTQDELKTSSLRIDNLEDELETNKTKIISLENELQEKQLEIKEQIEVNNGLNSKITDIQTQLDAKTKESNSHAQEVTRVKEHHMLLQKQVTTLSKEIDIKTKELDDMTIMIGKQKENEQKLLSEQSNYKNKLNELTNTINQKNIASLELTKKVKEIDTLNLKSNELTEKLNQAQERETKYKGALEEIKNKISDHKSVSPQEVDNIIETEKTEGLLSKLEHTIKGNISTISDKLNTSKISTGKEGFNFMKFAKKALNNITETRKEIDRKADEAIEEYKNRK